MEPSQPKVRTNWNLYYLGLIVVACAMFAAIWFQAFWIFGPLFLAVFALSLYGFAKMVPLFRRWRELVWFRGAILDNKSSLYLAVGGALSVIALIFYMVARRIWT